MVRDWLDQQNFHHQVLLFVVSVSIATRNLLHRHLAVEEILIELAALHDYYCLVLIHLRKYKPTLVIQTDEMAYLLQLRL